MIRNKQDQYSRLQDSLNGISGVNGASHHIEREVPMQMFDEGIDLLKVAQIAEADQKNVPESEKDQKDFLDKSPSFESGNFLNNSSSLDP